MTTYYTGPKEWFGHMYCAVQEGRELWLLPGTSKYGQQLAAFQIGGRQ